MHFNILGLLGSFRRLFIDGKPYLDLAFIQIPSVILLFYWNSNFLVPSYLSNKSWWKYIGGLVFSTLILIHIGYFFVELLFDRGYQMEFNHPTEFYDYSLILHLVVIGISTSLGVSNIAMKNAEQKEKAEELQKDAEMKYLSAQINPHFLYNTLNGIYAQAIEDDAEKTSEMILQLSEIMRYPLKNVSRERVTLSEEIAFVESFIHLQQVRLGTDYPISFTKEGNLKHVYVIPFSIIPIVENAFKHGVSQGARSPISFNLAVENKNITFTSTNKRLHSTDTKSHHIGMQNLKSRLDLFCEDKYTLNVSESTVSYKVELKIQDLQSKI